MTNDKAQAAWGPIPDPYPAGNDALRELRSPIRHYLDHTDGHWHLGIPGPLDYVPHLETMFEVNRRALDDELARAPIWADPTPRRRHTTRRAAIARPLVWLDDNVSARIRIPRLVVLLGLVALGIGAFGIYSYTVS